MNRLCRDLGHSWLSVSSQTYRVCKREDCRASERLVNGQWESLLPLYRKHHPVIEQQPALWETAHERTLS